jgi:hypothetical protein
MSVATDSYMTMILPDDISGRISAFMAGKVDFPFIKPDEITCLFYLYGRSSGIGDESKANDAADLAGRTASQMGLDIDRFSHSMQKVDSEFIRSEYVNRQLQLVIENNDQAKIRVLSDPMILSNCFARHASYYNQDYFFQLYGPFKESELIADIRGQLAGRMAMLCYNRKGEKEIPFTHPLIPLYVWIRDNKFSSV